MSCTRSLRHWLSLQENPTGSTNLASTVFREIPSAKELGFSLKEIKELLALRLAPGATCGRVKKHAEAKIEDIEDRIKTLQRMKRALRKLSDACGGKGSVSECPILDALDEGKKR